MKKLLTCLSLLWSAHIALAQSPNALLQVYTGGGQPYVMLADVVTGELKELKMKAAEQGYQLPLSLFCPNEIVVTTGDAYFHLLLDAGDTVMITTEGKTATFTGSHAATNKLMNTFMQQLLGPDSWARGKEINKYIPGASLDTTRTFLRNRYQKDSALLTAFIKKEKPDVLFIQWAQQHILYEYGAELLRAVSFKRGKDAPPASYFDFFDQFPINTPTQLWSTSYFNFLDDFHQYALDEVLEKKKGITYYDSLPAGTGRDILVTHYINELLDAQLVSFITKDKQHLLQLIGTPAIQSAIWKKYDKILAERNNNTVGAGSRIHSTPADTSLSAFTAAYKGKVIYVDVWGTWCAPCREQMPYSKQLHDSLKGKDIVFMYLCVESDPSSWKPMIRQLNIDGEHFLLNKEQYVALKSAYDITGVPHYMILDKSGRLVANNAPWPSDKSLKDLLLALADTE